MAKKSTYQLKQLIPEEKPETGTKYIVRKPTKGMKVSDKLRQRKYDPVLKQHVWFVERKCLLIANNFANISISNIELYTGFVVICV